MSKTTDLPAAALAQALATRQRANARFTAEGLIHYSDAGSQYTALAFTEELRRPASPARSGPSVTRWTTR